MEDKHSIVLSGEEGTRFVQSMNDKTVANYVRDELIIFVNDLKYLHRLFQSGFKDEWYVRRVANDCYLLITNDYRGDKYSREFSKGMRYINDDIKRAIKGILSDPRNVHTASFLELGESGKIPELIQYIREIIQCLVRI